MGRRLVFPAPGRVEIEPFAADPPGPAEVSLRAICTLISTGTETTVLNRTFDAGTHWDRYGKLPFHPGYSFLGEVQSVGEGVTSFSVGDRVVTQGHHSSEEVMPESACVRVPDGVTNDVAVWSTLVKIAAVGARAAEYRMGQRVLILGAGPIGQMTIRWARAAGAEAIVTADVAESRLEHAVRGGATEVFQGPASELVAGIRDRGEELFDVVIDTTGSAAVFESAIAAAQRFGRVVVLGDTGSPSSQHLTPEVMGKNLTIAGAHAKNETPDWDRPRILRLFFNFHRDGRFRMDGLNTHSFQPEACQEAYDLVNQRRAETMGVVFDWES